MKMFVAFFLALMVVAYVGAAVDDPPPVVEAKEQLSGQYSDYKDATTSVIKSRKDWRNVWMNLHKGQRPHKIDFTFWRAEAPTS